MRAVRDGDLAASCMVFYSAILSPQVLNLRRNASKDSLERADSPGRSGTPNTSHSSARSPTGHLASGECASSSTACTERSVGADFDIDVELPLRLPPQVISKVLELFTFVTNKEKKRRLRDALLVSAAQLELSSALSSADRNSEKVEGRAKVKAEIRSALHPDEVGLGTRRLVRGKSDRGKATSVDTSFGPEMPLSLPDGVDDVQVGRGNNDSVFRTPSNPDGLDPTELSSIVHKMTGEAQVLA